MSPIRLISVVLFACVLLGCEKKLERTPETVAQLQGRLAAAKQMTSMTEKDDACRMVAQDAAELSEPAIALEALQQISSLTVRDAAAEVCAKKLISLGKPADATKVANTISSINLRDSVLKRIAGGF